MKAKNISLCAIFTALIAVSAFIRIPIPPVPFTAQTIFVLLSGLILGGRYGALSCIIYFVIGFIGIPIFTSGGGPGCLIQPTGGFILGFIPAAFAVGYINGNKASFRHSFFSVLMGNLVLYIFAIAYAYILSNFILNGSVALSALLVSYCAVFIPSDIIKAAISAYVYVKLKKAGI